MHRDFISQAERLSLALSAGLRPRLVHIYYCTWSHKPYSTYCLRSHKPYSIYIVHGRISHVLLIVYGRLNRIALCYFVVVMTVCFPRFCHPTEYFIQYTLLLCGLVLYLFLRNNLGLTLLVLCNFPLHYVLEFLSLSEDFIFVILGIPISGNEQQIFYFLKSSAILFHDLWTSCSVHELTCHSIIPPSVNCQFYSSLEYYSAHFTEVLFRPTPPTLYVYMVTYHTIHSSVYVTVPWLGGKAQPTSS